VLVLAVVLGSSVVFLAPLGVATKDEIISQSYSELLAVKISLLFKNI